MNNTIPCYEQLCNELEQQGWPILVKECLLGTPKQFRIANIMSVLSACTVYLDQTTFRYTSTEIMRPVMQVVVIAKKGAGKGSFISKALKDVIAPLKRKEKNEWKAWQDWVDAGEDRALPHPFRQYLPDDFTLPAIREAIKNAEGHTLYFLTDEMDTFMCGSEYLKVLGVLRKAYNGETDGALRKSKEGYSGMADPWISFSLFGTPDQGQRLLGGPNAINGTADRMIVCLCEKKRTKRIPTVEQRTDEDRQQIEKGVNLLRAQSAKGFIDTPLMREEIDKWYAEMQDYIDEHLEEEDLLNDILIRTCINACRAYIPFLVLSGGVENEQTLKFLRMAAEYIFAMKYSIEKGDWFAGQKKTEMPVVQKLPTRMKIDWTDVYNQLPNQFTTADAKTIVGEGWTDEKWRQKISSWKSSGYIDDGVKTGKSKKWTKKVLGE